MKKILYIITQSEWGGAQKYVYELATAPEAQNYDITVAIGNWGDRSLNHKLSQKNIKIRQLKHLIRPISPINDLLAIFELKRLYKELKPDIIHLNSSKAGVIGSLATFKLSTLNFKLIYTVHGWVFNENIAVWKKQIYLITEKLTARLKNKIIFITQADLKSAQEHKIKIKDYSIIYNGIDPNINFLPPEQARQELTINYPLPVTGYKIIIGTIANFYETKGLQYLIESMYILIADYQLPVTLIIIGDGELRSQLEQQIKNLNLQENIILAGKKENAAQYLKAFDMYICSSVKEGLSYTLLEAGLAELPIIATRVGGNREIIFDIPQLQTGILIPPKNPKQLAEKISYLMQNKTVAEKLAQQSKINIKKMFSKEKMIRETFLQY